MPSNAGYYEVAYIAAAVILVGYALTLAVRMRALRVRLEVARDQQDGRE
ncbi:MAG: hypothetical protein M3Z10_06470 [Gemmatimonadota bacterium]|nr:hypothetical protein [Gemmatimonadota bacterium]